MDPNRYHMWTGFTGNDFTGGGPVLGNDEAGYGWTTYPERLERAGVSWRIYQDESIGLDLRLVLINAGDVPGRLTVADAYSGRSVTYTMRGRGIGGREYRSRQMVRRGAG